MTSSTIVFDTETTGLHADTDEILEIGIVSGDGEVVLERRYKPQHTESWDGAALDVNPADLIGDWGYIDEGALESVGRAVDLVVAHIDDLTLAQREAIALALARRS